MNQTRKSRWLGNLLSLAVVVSVAYGTGFFSRWSGKTLSSDEIVAQVKAPGSQVLDVREESEIKEGMLKAAKWVPLSGIQNQDPATLKKISELDHKKPVYIYCRSGNRAGKVAQILKAQDFEPINIGGFSDLAAAGLETTVP